MIAQVIAVKDKIDFERASIFAHELLNDPNFEIDDSF
jgi:hypothetical protein